MTLEFKYRRFAEALYRALREDPFYKTMERSIGKKSSAKEAMLRYMEFSMIEGEKYGILHIPEGHDYGVSIWAKPLDDRLKAQKFEEKRSFLRDQMGEESLKTYETIVGFMSAQSKRYVGRGWWYLSIVGIAPEFQRRGLGYGLVKPVLDEADLLNIPTYLETFSPGNMAFYERLGYQTVASFHEPVFDLHYWLMLRQPLGE